MAILRPPKFPLRDMVEFSKWLQEQKIEVDLGVPTADGYVLSSTVAGVRSWTSMDGRTDKPAHLQLPTAPTTSLVDRDSIQNRVDKTAGKVVFNTTTNRPVYATGSIDTDPWVDATGATAHTPA